MKILAMLLMLTLSQDNLKYVQKHWVDEDVKIVTLILDEAITREAELKLYETIHLQGYHIVIIDPEQPNEVEDRDE